MKLPAPVPLDAEIARAIATRHAVPAEPFSPLENTGIINSVYALGSLVLRVPRDHPAHVDQLRREAAVVPLARAAGVRTPGVVAFDDCCDLLPVPYLLVERVPDVALGVLAGDPGAAENAWSAVGRDLARLHASPPPEVVDGWFHEIGDARELVVRRAREGWFSSVEEG